MTVPDTATERFVRRPAVASSILALVLGGVAVALVADSTLQREVLQQAVVGVAAFGLGGRLVRHERTATSGLGALLAIGGGALVLVSIGTAATQPPQVTNRIELLPGIAGIWTLSAALAPIRLRWSRILIDVGTGLVFLGVLVTGVTQGVSSTALLLAACATIIAWDVAENAVSVGGQLGVHRGASTARAELAHAGVGAVVGIVAVGVILVVVRLGIDGLPFGALLALLVGSVVLVLGTHR